MVRSRSHRLQIAVSLIALLVLLITMLVGEITQHASAIGPFFTDNFESVAVGSPDLAWTTQSGTWVVEQDGTHVLAQTDTDTTIKKVVSAGAASWANYAFNVDIKPGANNLAGSTEIMADFVDVNNYYSLLLQNTNQWQLGKNVLGVWTPLAQGTFAYTSQFYVITLQVLNQSVKAWINGTLLAALQDSAFSQGLIAVGTFGQAEIDNVTVLTPPAQRLPPQKVPPTSTHTPTLTPTATNTPTPLPTPTNTPTPIPSGTPTPPPMGVGTIFGQVTDGSGTPISGATVTTLPASITAQTDSSGNYTLANIPAGLYTVLASASGYNSSYVPNVFITNGDSVPANLTLPIVPAFTSMDTYDRPDQTGWNPSSDGNTWADDSASSPGATFSIKGNTGYVDTFTAATDLDQWMGSTYTDELISADFEVLQFGQDSFQHGPRLLARVADSTHYLLLAININNSTLQLWENKGGTWVQLKQVSVSRLSVNQWYHARMLAAGNLVYGKVWAYGTSEPNWQIGSTESVFKTGKGGIRSTFCNIFWANFSVQGLTTITGRVTNSTTGTGISGATVTDGSNTTTTDVNGYYVLIEPNRSATYTVTASATGFTSQSQSVTTTLQATVVANFALT